jgi:hypothetical protein
MLISLEGLMHDPMLLLKPLRQNGLMGDICVNPVIRIMYLY